MGNRDSKQVVHDERGASAKRKICKFFLSGRCDRGKECRFLHEEEGQQLSSIDVEVAATAAVVSSMVDPIPLQEHPQKVQGGAKEKTKSRPESGWGSGTKEYVPPNERELREMSDRQRDIENQYIIFRALYQIKLKASNRYKLGFLQRDFLKVIFGPLIDCPPDHELLYCIDTTSPVNSLCAMQMKKEVFSGHYDCIIRSWDATSATQMNTMCGHEGELECLMACHGMLLSGSVDSSMIVWKKNVPSPNVGGAATASAKASGSKLNVKEQKTAKKIKEEEAQLKAQEYYTKHRSLLGHVGYVTCMTHNASNVYSGSFSPEILVHNILGSSFNQVAVLKGHTAGVNCLLLDHVKKRLYSGSYDRDIRVWDTNTHGSCLATLSGHKSFIYSIYMHEHLIFSGSGSDDHSIKVWNTDTLELATTLNGHSGIVYSLAISGASVSVGAGASSENEKSNGGSSSGYNKEYENIYATTTTTIATTGKIKLYSGNEDSTIRVWNVNVKDSDVIYKTTLQGHKNGVWRLLIRRNKLYSASMDSTVRVWNTYNDELIIILSGHTREVKCMVVCDNKLFTGSEDRTIRIWRCR